MSLPKRLSESIAFRFERHRWSRRGSQTPLSVGVGGAGTVFVDVFDTVLVRSMLGGEPAIEVVARGLGSDAQAFREARWTAGQREGTIEAIASEAAQALARPMDPRRLVAMEEQAERDLCVAAPGVKEWLSRLRRAGKQVVFVSDMHHPAEFIGALLRREGLLDDADELVVSSEWGVTKRSGLLLDAVIEKLGLTASQVVHVGNDIITDGVMARRAGLAVMPAAIANPTRFERIWASGASANGQLGAVIGGAARKARLELSVESDQRTNDALIGVATGVGGAVGVSFLLFVLRSARERGIDTLYFVARDGEILKRMAEALPAEYTEGLTLRYLHANRRTVALSLASVIGAERWIEQGVARPDSRILDGAARVPWRNLCERVGLDPRSVAELCHELGGFDEHQPVPASAIPIFVQFLRTPVARAAVQQAADERAKLVSAYYRQSGLHVGAAALVDVGWTGQLAQSIATVARPDDPTALMSLHFGSLAKPPAQTIVETFLPHHRAGIDGFVVCAETFTASNEAPMIGLEQRGDAGVEPVFAGGPSTRSVVRDQMQTAMVETARQMPAPTRAAGWADLGGDVAACSAEVLAALWMAPTRSEALALAPLLFESDDAGRVVTGLTEPLRFGPQATRRVWGQGSIAVSSLPLRLVSIARRRVRSGT